MKNKITILILIMNQQLNAETVFRIDGKNNFNVQEAFENYEYSEWITTSTEITDSLPLLYSQKTNFNQTYKEIENQKRDKIGVKEVNGNIIKKVVGSESRIIENQKSRNVTVESVNNDINERNCNEWLPNQSDFNVLEEVSQSQTCTYDKEITYTYKVNGNIIGINKEIDSIIEKDKNRTINGTKTVNIFANYKGNELTPEGLEAGCTYEYLGSILKVESGNQCIFSLKASSNITYTINPSKKTVIEFYVSGYANTGGYSYITDGAPSTSSDNGSNGFGGFVYINGYPALFGYPCANMNSCHRGGSTSRETVNAHTDIKRYKFVYQNGILSYYINNNLIKSLPKSYKANNFLDIGVNKGHIHIGEIKIYNE